MEQSQVRGASAMQSVPYTVSRRFQSPTVRIECREYEWLEPVEIRQGPAGYYLTKTISGHHVETRALEFCDTIPHEKVCIGPLAFMPAQDPIHMWIASGKLSNLVCIFEPTTFERIAGLDRPIGAAELAKLLTLHNLSIDYTMERLHGEISSPGFSSEIMVEALCTSLIVEFGRHLLRQHQSHTLPGKRRAIDIGAIKQYIAEHGGCGISIADLARISGISENHLMKSFKEATGETIHSFFSSIRLRQAEEFLLDTPWSMKQIAYNLGFASPSDFSAAFRKSKGETPTQFRQRMSSAR